MADLVDVVGESRWTCEDCEEIHEATISAADMGHGIGLSVSIQQPDQTLVEHLR